MSPLRRRKEGRGLPSRSPPLNATRSREGAPSPTRGLPLAAAEGARGCAVGWGRRRRRPSRAPQRGDGRREGERGPAKKNPGGEAKSSTRLE
eukprot:scaffold256443_cov33-Tisochrysis_lutea.AAC.6